MSLSCPECGRTVRALAGTCRCSHCGSTFRPDQAFTFRPEAARDAAVAAIALGLLSARDAADREGGDGVEAMAEAVLSMVENGIREAARAR